MNQIMLTEHAGLLGEVAVYLAKKPTLAVTAIASRHHTLTRPLSHPSQYSYFRCHQQKHRQKFPTEGKRHKGLSYHNTHIPIRYVC